MDRLFVTLLLALLSVSCTQLPEGVEPVRPFDVQRYLGDWHEIARLDHSFERGLSEVKASYSLRSDGGIRVVNTGYNAQSKEWDKAEGKAYFVDDSSTGRLKVSFFGPFYGGYNIAMLEPDYSMALVVGPSLDYAWILARTSSPSSALCLRYQQAAERLGIKPTDWIQVRSCQNN